MTVWISNRETSREAYKIKSLTAVFLKNWKARYEAFDERRELIEKRWNLKKGGSKNEEN